MSIDRRRRYVKAMRKTRAARQRNVRLIERAEGVRDYGAHCQGGDDDDCSPTDRAPTREPAPGSLEDWDCSDISYSSDEDERADRCIGDRDCGTLQEDTPPVANDSVRDQRKPPHRDGRTVLLNHQRIRVPELLFRHANNN